MTQKKKFPGTTVSGMFEGKGFTVVQTNIDARTYDNFQKLMEQMEVGGMLRVKKAPEGSKVFGFLEYLTPAEVEAEKERYMEWKKANAKTTPRATL